MRAADCTAENLRLSRSPASYYNINSTINNTAVYLIIFYWLNKILKGWVELLEVLKLLNNQNWCLKSQNWIKLISIYWNESHYLTTTLLFERDWNFRKSTYGTLIEIVDHTRKKFHFTNKSDREFRKAYLRQISYQRIYCSIRANTMSIFDRNSTSSEKMIIVWLWPERALNHKRWNCRVTIKLLQLLRRDAVSARMTALKSGTMRLK